MADHTIKIDLGGYNANNQPWLKISVDGGSWTTSSSEDEELVTEVIAGQSVQFVISSGSPITSIDAIIDKSADGFDIFKVDPTESNAWTGIIGTVKGEEPYAIEYTLNGRQYTEDPKMRMI